MTARAEYATSDPPSDARVQGWLDDGIRNLSCPRCGAHLKDGALVLSEHVFRCKAKPGAGARECGALIWTTHNLRANVTYAAEVTWQDVRTIQTHSTVLETLRYLGAPLWPRRIVSGRTVTGSAT